MGGEGANWIGEAPFSTRGHVFQNIGDGTYYHSGMPGDPRRGRGRRQHHLQDPLQRRRRHDRRPADRRRPAHRAEDRPRRSRPKAPRRIVVVSDEPDKYPAARRGRPGTTVHHRDELDAVQRELREVGGVSVLIYDQTCAAEKRRRRKRGLYPDPDQRVVINELVCEGCGDCGVQSNCVAILPLETEFGRKRKIDQSSCNKDFSCLEGLLPELRHRGRRDAAQARRACGRSRDRLARAERRAADGELRHPDHRRRRHRRGHGRRAPRHGRASRGQGRGGHRHGRPRAEGRRGDQPCAHRPAADDIQAIRIAGGRRRRHARLRPRRRRLGQVARRDRARTDAGRMSTRTRRCPATSPATPISPCRPDACCRRSRARRRRAVAHPRRDTRSRRRSLGDAIAPNMFMLGFAWQAGSSRCRARRSSGRSS